jgi:hypothetical protein
MPVVCATVRCVDAIARNDLKLSSVVATIIHLGPRANPVQLHVI